MTEVSKVHETFQKCLKADTQIDPSKDFLSSKAEISSSKIFCFLSFMPKGALLHTHGLATGCFKKLVDILHDDPKLYYYIGPPDQGYVPDELRFLNDDEISDSWGMISELDKEALLSKLVLSSTVKRQDRWNEFGMIWTRILDVSNCLRYIRGKSSFLWTILTDLYKTHVRYFEFKKVIHHAFVDEFKGKVSRTSTIHVFMETFLETVEAFKKEHPR